MSATQENRNDAPKKFCRRYPWVRWFSQRKFRLIRGRDYDCFTHAMAQMVRNAAAPKRHNVRVSISVEGDGESLTVRVLQNLRP